ncbi:MAG TPA: SDR family NAD(P)-dependent oxidoreductase [Chloroflexia bacterium]|nr:SDR family NAD(P)-dependent oxidoreductase [Chloroflexia bacterium]
MQVENSTFLISGGGSGLGAACARRLAGAGANVVIADINPAAGESVAGAIGARARFVRVDVTDEASVTAALETAHSTFGGLQGAINCAGIAIAEKVLGKEGPHALDRFTRVVMVNLVGTFNVIRLASAAMAQGTPTADGERGVIICTASVAAFEGQIGQAAYSASKGGVAAMTLPVARELARSGIRVVTIAPGIFDTPMLAGLPEPARQSLGQQVPFPSRLGRPEEFAELVASVFGIAMINGETIRLDGAIRMQPK